MKSVIFAFLVASLCLGSATAQELGSTSELPVKSTPIVSYAPLAEPLQGGDTIEDATIFLSLPFRATGTTAGYTDDYDEACPSGATSPDVVYSYMADFSGSIIVDLCSSAYSTKIFVYDTDLNVVACKSSQYSSNPCGDHPSLVDNFQVTPGMTYYIVVDGNHGDEGPYELTVEGIEGPYVYCPPEAVLEGEPPLHDGYVDLYNGGCGSPDPYEHFQEIDWVFFGGYLDPLDDHALTCGQSGWFLGEDGDPARDTDWFKAFADENGIMEFTVESEYPMYMFQLVVQPCASVEVALSATADCGAPATLAIPVLAGEEIWLWVGPTTFEGPVTEFTYFATLNNHIHEYDIPNEEMSWGGVKALYR